MKIYVIMFFGQAEPKSKEGVTRIRESSQRRALLAGFRLPNRLTYMPDGWAIAGSASSAIKPRKLKRLRF